MCKTIVMLDDDISICMMMKKLVEREGVAFVFADNLIEGTFEISLNKPDIAIVDFEFQYGKNILSILPVLKRKAKKVIILTAANPIELRRKHPELAFTQIINKSEGGIRAAAEMATA